MKIKIPSLAVLVIIGTDLLARGQRKVLSRRFYPR
jgi:hypothetical protein